MLIFGFETTFRSLHKKRFQYQKRWNILLCVISILILTCVTWVPSKAFPRPGACLASLIWWTTPFARIGLVIASGLLLTYIVCAVVITAQLIRTIKMSRDQRIAATRVVYYLIVSAIITVNPGCMLSQGLTDGLPGTRASFLCPKDNAH